MKQNDEKETKRVPALAPVPAPAAAVPAVVGAALDQRLGTLFDAHGAGLVRAALRVTGVEADAEDAVQTVFLRLLRREELLDFDHPGVVGYLHRAVVNAALDLLRSRRRAQVDRDADASLEASQEAGPERRLAGRELAAALRVALADVSPRGAEIFAMRYFDDIPNNEIAARLGTSAGVVAVTLHRTRHQLQGALARLIGEPS